MKLSKCELCLSNFILSNIKNKIVLNHSRGFILLVICFVTDTNEHEWTFCSLPHGIHSYLHCSHSIRNTNLLFHFVNFKFSVRIISKIISPELPLIIVPCFKPSHHRMMIGLFNNILICPFFFFRWVYIKWYGILF